MISRAIAEYTIVTRIQEALAGTEYSNAIISASPPADKAKFPYIYIQLTDSPESSNTADTILEEHYIDLTFQVDIYTNEDNGDIDCMKMMDLILACMKRLNFKTDANTPMPKQNNDSIYRRTARFIGRWDGTKFYRR